MIEVAFFKNFLSVFKEYFVEMFFPLLGGLVASGVIHEFVPTAWVEKHLGEGRIKSIFYSTIVGTIVPVCCWGSLPIAVSFHKKGASLGPIFAILAATPATSINALFVAAKFFGLKFTIYIFFAVISIGITMGLIGNLFKVKTSPKPDTHTHSSGKEQDASCPLCYEKKPLSGRIKSVFKYAFIDMPREIGFEVILGIFLAAAVSTITPIGQWIRSYLNEGYGYLFAIIFGLVVYMCATMSVPLVHAFVNQGLNIGPGLALLILGPIASYGTILVLRKEFGFKVLFVFLLSISLLSVIAGYLYSLL